MKKILALLLVVLLGVALVGCGDKEPQRSDEGWALHYAIEYHEDRVERLPKEYAYSVEELELVGVDDSCMKLSCSVLYFEVTIVTNFETYNYYVMMEKIDTIWKYYTDANIIEYDVELGEEIENDIPQQYYSKDEVDQLIQDQIDELELIIDNLEEIIFENQAKIQWEDLTDEQKQLLLQQLYSVLEDEVDDGQIIHIIDEVLNENGFYEEYDTQVEVYIREYFEQMLIDLIEEIEGTHDEN